MPSSSSSRTVRRRSVLASELRALLWLTGAAALRLLREGLVVRALAWPGLLAAGSLVGAAAVVGWSARAPSIAVETTTPVELHRRLEEAGFAVQIAADPVEVAASGAVARALVQAGEDWVLWSTLDDPATQRAEAAVREGIDAPWIANAAAAPARPPEGDRASEGLAALLGMLFTLYGVVVGAGTVFRDRDEGVLEAELALPLPFWVHGAARWMAGAAVLCAGLGTTLLLLHGLMGVPQLGRWWWLGTAAGASGVALGLGAMAGQTGGLSSPLSRALSVSLGLAALGWGLPALGAWLPVASLAAQSRGLDGIGSVFGVVLGTGGLAVAAIRSFARGERR